MLNLCDFFLLHVVGSTTHNERETARIEGGLDQFGDNVKDIKEGIKCQRD